VRAPRAGGREGAGLKGRYWVMLWLTCFLGVAAVVQWRQGQAYAVGRDLASLERSRGALEVTKANLTGRIRRDESRAALVPLAERRLGLRLPLDSEIVILQAPGPR